MLPSLASRKSIVPGITEKLPGIPLAYAAKQTEILLRSWRPRREDMTILAGQITRLFTQYPVEAVNAVVEKLPLDQEHPPEVFHVKQALEREVAGDRAKLRRWQPTLREDERTPVEPITPERQRRLEEFATIRDSSLDQHRSPRATRPEPATAAQSRARRMADPVLNHCTKGGIISSGVFERAKSEPPDAADPLLPWEEQEREEAERLKASWQDDFLLYWDEP